MIETERLRLRPFGDGDRSAFAAILNTPAMMAHIGGVKSSSEIDALIDKRIADQACDGFSYWAVERRAKRGLIGSCGVRIARNYSGTPVAGVHEIGWRIAEAQWGKGYAREAAQATLRWLWTNTGAALAAAWTTIGNVPSWRLMERLGMTRRRDLDFRHPGMAADDAQAALIVYTLARPR